MGDLKNWCNICLWAGVMLGLAIVCPGIVQTGNADSYSTHITGLGEPWSDKTGSYGNLVILQSSDAFDYGDPTAAEQAHLEAINRARLDPVGEAARLGIDLFEGVSFGAISGSPVQPLVFNTKLITAARLHSQDMIDQDYFAHESWDGKSPFDRMQAAGYVYASAGENLASYMGSTGPLDKVSTALALHDNLFLDENYPNRGHRVNILTESF